MKTSPAGEVFLRNEQTDCKRAPARGIIASPETNSPIRRKEEVKTMSSRLAVVSIIVENPDSVETVNRLLHDASKYIIGRMGVPYREKGISLISVALDAPQDVISALSGSIGHLNGVSSKTAYSHIITEDAGED